MGKAGATVAILGLLQSGVMIYDQTVKAVMGFGAMVLLPKPHRLHVYSILLFPPSRFPIFPNLVDCDHGVGVFPIEDTDLE